MPCEECRDLVAHAFKTQADLVNALQGAAGEVDRGVLVPLVERDQTIPELMAVRSALESGALPGVVRYRFNCSVCGDGFELSADTNLGTGEWKRT
jgi:hypothetical protein